MSASSPLTTAFAGAIEQRIPAVLHGLVTDEYLFDTAIFDQIKKDQSVLTDALQGRLIKLLQAPSYRFQFTEVATVQQALLERRVLKQKEGADLTAEESALYLVARGIFQDKLAALDGFETTCSNHKATYDRLVAKDSPAGASSSAAAPAPVELSEQLETVTTLGAAIRSELERVVFNPMPAADEFVPLCDMITLNAQISSFRAQAKMLFANIMTLEATDIKERYRQVINELFDSIEQGFTTKLTYYKDQLNEKLARFDERMAGKRPQGIEAGDTSDLQMGINRFCQAKELADSLLAVLQELRIGFEQAEKPSIDQQLKTLQDDLEKVADEIIKANGESKGLSLMLIQAQLPKIRAITAQLKQTEPSQVIQIRARLFDIAERFRGQIASVGQAGVLAATEAAKEQSDQAGALGGPMTPAMMLELQQKMEALRQAACFASDMLRASRALCLAVSA